MHVIDLLTAFFKHQGCDKIYWVAYSGGLDSQVLLDVCVHLREQLHFLLQAVHIHHGLSPEADAWHAHCQQYCQQAQVPLTSLAITTKPSIGESVEDFARRERYAKFKQILTEQAILMTAHHQDDQAETVLLQLMRGAGLQGLSAMPAKKPLGVGFHARPLLNATRDELHAYATHKNLSWVEDELNHEQRFARNFLRHQVIPLLKKRWPAVNATLARAATHCAEAQKILTDFATEQLAELRGSQPNTLSLAQLRLLSVDKQRLVLRAWLKEHHASLPSSLQLQQIIQTFLTAGNDRFPSTRWGAHLLRRYQDDLYLLPLNHSFANETSYHWDFSQDLMIPGVGELSAIPSYGGLQQGITQAVVRFRQGGEVYRLANGQHHALKKFFQEHKIPPWQRMRLPLIYVADELVAIPGYLIVPAFKAPPGQLGLNLLFKSIG